LDLLPLKSGIQDIALGAIRQGLGMELGGQKVLEPPGEMGGFEVYGGLITFANALRERIGFLNDPLF
jgi:hypothetical protein